MKKHKKRGTSYLLSAVMIGALLAGTGVSALAEGEPGTVGAENTSVGISAPESNGTATSSVEVQEMRHLKDSHPMER